MEQFREPDPDRRGPDAPDRDTTDEQLLVAMANGGEDERRRAFEELYRRHAPALYHSFRWVAPAHYYGCDDLLQDTFVRAFERAATFRAEDLDAEAARRRVRAWLGTIADRLVKESWPRDRQGFVRLVNLTQECWQGLAGALPEPGADGAAARVRGALAQLKTRDREILLLYMQWYDPELEKQRVPPAIVDQICAHYGIERPNFRQIVSRAIRRVEAALGSGA